jgi:hypothetical protein
VPHAKLQRSKQCHPFPGRRIDMAEQ